MAKHTPGPWRILDYDNGITGQYGLRGIFPPAVQGQTKQAPIVEGVWGATIEESDANARLIAEAPAMRELLTRLVDSESHNRVQVELRQTEARALLARIDGAEPGPEPEAEPIAPTHTNAKRNSRKKPGRRS